MSTSTIVQCSKSVCPYCGTGCGVLIEHDGDKILGVRGDPEHPANYGQLCSKGMTLAQTVHGPGRASMPLQRRDGEHWREHDWEQALSDIASSWAEIYRDNGPQALAFYVSGQLPTEDYYVANKLAKGFLGTNHIDTNSRLCMASAVTGYKRSLGMDSVPCSYEDLESTDCLLIVGANVAYAHPILFRRIEAHKARRPELRIIVVDPRRTATASIADLFLPILPGTDVALFHGILHLLIWNDWVDETFIREHTQGWQELKQRVQEYTPQRVAEICNIPEHDLRQAAEIFGTAPRALSLWCQGLNQSAHGTDNNVALINLHLATGQIGRPGAGPFSLTGQPNAMGGRETGGMPALLPGHREVTNAEHRAAIAELWGVDALNPEPGLTAVPMYQALERGDLAAIWITCTNPILSLPDRKQVERALRNAKHVVLQESYLDGETMPFAHWLLPAASWGEREALVTNSERRISHLQAAIPAPGTARPDWQIFCDFAHALGLALDRLDVPLPDQRDRSWQERAARMFAFQDTASIFAEYRRCTQGRDLDISGLDLTILDTQGPQQWPFPEGAEGGKKRLYADGIFPTPNGRARFHAPDHLGVAEEIDAHYPLRLTTGRLRDQWHSMARTGRVASLFASAEEAYLHIHPQDAQRFTLSEGMLVVVESRRGENIYRLRLDDSLQIGLLFAPMHFGIRNAPAALCNTVTLPAIDPYSGEPEFKHAAVRVRKADLPWEGAVLLEDDGGNQSSLVRKLAQGFPYASTTPLISQRGQAILLRVAAEQAPERNLAEQWDVALGLTGPETLLYEDPLSGISKRLRIHDGRLAAIRLWGTVETLDWLRQLFLEDVEIGSYRIALLAPRVPADLGVWRRSRGICACKGIDEMTVQQAIMHGADTLEAVMRACGAGTECGSCKPEILQLLQGGFAEAS
ncbi:molybdopterin-dependent oxidoreductase [Acidithiobacillus caldus]|uniref:Assimilatory nitrate reductase n=1 Tax=Acidithiobacillus caldus (strain SM-1) TaxID=990288 RepID=F9ZLM3_ACICS|nr:nitrate reductase [Acidithiobacillus caldus]AEK57773.1 assimilatory nitrate reductase [Acidithiobacillus caldus SM-1]AUW32459.1 molybdopterin-dependent oxidoreductase [Acidithiobacillus caldus]MBU2783730.1 molybdopterin-dependent oxidoreductase [Acidithiobacillus caldus]MBU2789553.1 molybdopterin-dependent oxidoreductase [Acidithiobacillus caldus]MBU2822116.1 molybdopterin-dependent oxidoreductase [Acidithiobacillus caldus]